MVQGHSFGPSSFDVMASDPLRAPNSIVKYGNDTYLIIPASARFTVSSKLEHISWDKLNNLRLNTDKSKEMIVQTRTRRSDQGITGVERINTMKILGVTVSDNLSADSHITDVYESSSHFLYALHALRSHGMPTIVLHEITRATTSSNSWWLW